MLSFWSSCGSKLPGTECRETGSLPSGSSLEAEQPRQADTEPTPEAAVPEQVSRAGADAVFDDLSAEGNQVEIGPDAPAANAGLGIAVPPVTDIDTRAVTRAVDELVAEEGEVFTGDEITLPGFIPPQDGTPVGAEQSARHLADSGERVSGESTPARSVPGLTRETGLLLPGSVVQAERGPGSFDREDVHDSAGWVTEPSRPRAAAIPREVAPRGPPGAGAGRFDSGPANLRSLHTLDEGRLAGLTGGGVHRLDPLAEHRGTTSEPFAFPGCAACDAWGAGEGQTGRCANPIAPASDASEGEGLPRLAQLAAVDLLVAGRMVGPPRGAGATTAGQRVASRSGLKRARASWQGPLLTAGELRGEPSGGGSGGGGASPPLVDEQEISGHAVGESAAL